MTINNVEIFFKKQEGNKLFFNTSSGEELAIDKQLLADFSEDDKRLFLNISQEKLSGSPKDVLNDILASQE